MILDLMLFGLCVCGYILVGQSPTCYFGILYFGGTSVRPIAFMKRDFGVDLIIHSVCLSFVHTRI